MAVLRMASPTKDPRTGMLYLNVRVPADFASQLAGKAVTLPIGSEFQSVKIGKTVVKVSLRTHDPVEGRARFAAAHAALLSFWETQRRAPERLTHKQRVALAGEVRMRVTARYDDDPLSPEVWQDVIRVNEHIKGGVGYVEAGGAAPATPEALAEYRYGSALDALLAERQIRLDPEDRAPLIAIVAEAMAEAAQVNLRKAEGDYTPDAGAGKYPAFVAAAPVVTNAKPKWTFEGVVKEQARLLSLGVDAAPLRPDTVKKYVRVAELFTDHRGRADVETLTSQEVSGWVRAMLEAGEISNRTIKDRLASLKTIVNYAIEQSDPPLFGGTSPAKDVKPPRVLAKAPGHFTHTMDEAKQLLMAARSQSRPELRWVWWIMAYSGARVGEITQLRKSDFRTVDGRAFFVIGGEGGLTVKNLSSLRTLPVHPDLVAEGLLAFVDGSADGYLFPNSSGDYLGEFARDDLKMRREGFRPNHGWRHLFEDMCMGSGISEKAKLYITGRSSGRSSDGYGGSDALLVGLARELDKFPSYLKD